MFVNLFYQICDGLFQYLSTLFSSFLIKKEVLQKFDQVIFSSILEQFTLNFLTGRKHYNVPICHIVMQVRKSFRCLLSARSYRFKILIIFQKIVAFQQLIRDVVAKTDFLNDWNIALDKRMWSWRRKYSRKRDDWNPYLTFLAIGEMKIANLFRHGMQSNPNQPILPLGSQVEPDFARFMAFPRAVHKPRSLPCFVAGELLFYTKKSLFVDRVP